MHKFIKENKRMLLSFLILIILFPIIILTPSPIGIISKDIGLQIVGYGGSIFGGFLTLYGVWWTLDYQKNKDKIELSIRNEPFLKIKSLKTIKFFRSYYKRQEIIIINQGLGPATNIILEPKKTTDDFILTMHNIDIKRLYPHEEMSLKYDLKATKAYIRKIDNKSPEQLQELSKEEPPQKIRMVIKYSDILNNNYNFYFTLQLDYYDFTFRYLEEYLCNI